jgi:hypothetical protein
MNIITKYPVLVNPVRPDVNDYKLNDPKFDLPGAIQKVEVGDFVVKGTNPVFDNDKEVTNNEFLFLNQIDDNGNVLTPMDEYLYSGRNYSDGKFDFGEFTTYGDVFENADGNPLRKPNPLSAGLPTGTISIPPSQYLANLQNIPGGPTAKEQADKAKKEGQFWNSLKGGFEKFRRSDNGQILLASGTSYIVDKLGGTVAPEVTAPVSPPADVKVPMSKTTKTILIVGSATVVALIIYSVLKKK